MDYNMSLMRQLRVTQLGKISWFCFGLKLKIKSSLTTFHFFNNDRMHLQRVKIFILAALL